MGCSKPTGEGACTVSDDDPFPPMSGRCCCRCRSASTENPPLPGRRRSAPCGETWDQESRARMAGRIDQQPRARPTLHGQTRKLGLPTAMRRGTRIIDHSIRLANAQPKTILYASCCCRGAVAAPDGDRTWWRSHPQNGAVPLENPAFRTPHRSLTCPAQAGRAGTRGCFRQNGASRLPKLPKPIAYVRFLFARSEFHSGSKRATRALH